MIYSSRRLRKERNNKKKKLRIGLILVVWLISCSCRLIFPLWVCGRLTIGVIRAIVYWLSSSPSMNSFRFRFLIFGVRRRYCIGRSQTSAQVGFPSHPHPLSPPSSQTEKYFLTSVKGISNKFQKKPAREKMELISLPQIYFATSCKTV